MLVLFAIWLLLSGLDDLFLDLAFLYRWLVTACLGRRRIRTPCEAELAGAPQNRIAIFVPLWREHNVVRNMMERNLHKNRYDRCEFFIGVYPNDEPTVSAVRDLVARFPMVHMSVCPHNGPSSKADNLNCMFEHMQQFESDHDARFDLVVTHDAEDLMHPESLRWINYYSQSYDMVQIPVLPLATPPRQFLHGVYCDEFADYLSKELPTRNFVGGFLPSCGTGAGFSRKALERLGAAHAGHIFEPSCLTEDYENGFRLHRLGCSQLIVPITWQDGEIVATRAYFPREFRVALRQRTRWITGIALQSWELNGWRETVGQLYWFWRDRKGLVGSLVAPFAIIVFLYGLAWWRLDIRVILDRSSVWITSAFALSLAMLAVNLTLRIGFSARVYGWRFACAMPLRILYGIGLNWLATASALDRYFRAKWNRQPLSWVKTDHSYPDRRLGEILVGSRYLTPDELEEALASQPSDFRIGEYLVHTGKLTERKLYECLSMQRSLEFQALDRTHISRAVARSLPAAVSRKWRVLGYKIVSGRLFVAGPEPPNKEMNADLRRFSSLEIHFHLITPTNFENLQQEFLPRVK